MEVNIAQCHSLPGALVTWLSITWGGHNTVSNKPALRCGATQIPFLFTLQSPVDVVPALVWLSSSQTACLLWHLDSLFSLMSVIVEHWFQELQIYECQITWYLHLIHNVQCRQVSSLKHIMQQARNNGVKDLEEMDGKAARGLEPELSCVAALHSPSTGIFDSHGWAWMALVFRVQWLSIGIFVAGRTRWVSHSSNWSSGLLKWENTLQLLALVLAAVVDSFKFVL